MLGLDPSIQGNRSVTRLWTLGSSPRVTIGEWQGCCVFCITTPPHTPLSSRHSLPGRQPWCGVDELILHEMYEGRHTSSRARALSRCAPRLCALSLVRELRRLRDSAADHLPCLPPTFADATGRQEIPLRGSAETAHRSAAAATGLP